MDSGTATLSAIVTALTLLFGWLKARDVLKFKAIESNTYATQVRVAALEAECVDLRKAEQECQERQLANRQRIDVLERARLDMLNVLTDIGKLNLVAVITVDDQGKIIEWGPQATVMFHWTTDEVMNRDIGIIIPPRMKQKHHMAFMACVGMKREPRIEPLLEIAMNRGGDEFQVSIQLSGWEVEGRWVYHARIRQV